LIINAGGGYYLLLAGMDRINVVLGQFVLAGEPVAVMGDSPKATAATAGSETSQPVLDIESRKDGTSIHPVALVGDIDSTRKFADNAQVINDHAWRGPWRWNRDAGDPEQAAVQQQRYRRRVGHLSSAEFVRRRIRKIRSDYVEKPEEAKLIEFGHQRYAVGARSAFQLHWTRRASRICRCRRAASSAASASR
jgi:hypothetical protein